jgi:hypothetical protein
MNPELERLVQALDLVRSCPSTKSEELAKLKAIYEGHLLELLEGHPQVSRESLASNSFRLRTSVRTSECCSASRFSGRKAS